MLQWDSVFFKAFNGEKKILNICYTKLRMLNKLVTNGMPMMEKDKKRNEL